MEISREYIAHLERLPCNRHARRRQQKHGQWLNGWVPEYRDEWPVQESIESFTSSFH